MEAISYKTKVLHPKSRYGFGELEVGSSVIVRGDYRIIRISADGFRKRWGRCFLVSDLKDGSVKVSRYK